MKVPIRRIARRLNIHRHHSALKANEQVMIRQIKRLMHDLLSRLTTVACMHGRKNTVTIRGTKIIVVLLLFYFSIVIDTDGPDPRHVLAIKNKCRTISSFSYSECWNFFETSKDDPSRLLLSLRIPDEVRLSNFSTMPGEEILLRGLYEVVSGEDQFNIAVNIFGRDQSQQSRAFTWFVDFIYSNFRNLVTNNLAWWYSNGYLERSKRAIKEKFGGNDNFTVCAFIDCNCLE